MSMENLGKFLKRIQEDEAVAGKVRELGNTDLKGIAAYGQELGYSFTVEDLEEAKKNNLQAGNELSEEDLEKASGGTFIYFIALPSYNMCY